MTWGEARMRVTQSLAEAGVDAAPIEARVILAHALGIPTSKLLAEPNSELDHLHEQAVNRMVKDRLRGVPVAYLTSRREFYGRDFFVNSSVLIPRHETELIIERALTLRSDRLRVCDIGTGSGAIAVTLKAEHPEWEVHALDLSPEALEVAERNAAALGAHITFHHADATTAWEGEPFNLLVSNPPYVETDAELAVEVRQFEPALALFAGADGLDFYRAFARVAKSYLVPGGRLILEHGKGQSEAIKALFPDFRSTAWDDLAGITRVLDLEWIQR